MLKRKGAVENGETPRKRGRPRKNANVVEGKEAGTATVPLLIEVSGGCCRFVTIMPCGGLEFPRGSRELLSIYEEFTCFLQNVAKAIYCMARSQCRAVDALPPPIPRLHT